MRGVRAAFVTNRGISPSAEGDLRRCLKKPRPFEKGRSKLFVIMTVTITLSANRGTGVSADPYSYLYILS